MMKQSITVTLFLLAFLPFMKAQKDCCSPFQLPGQTPFAFTFSGTAGGGLPDDVSCSCLTGEGGSFWFSFSPTASGTLEFIIEPTLSQAPPNYDFSLWEKSCPCQGSGTNPGPFTNPVVCNSNVGNAATGVATDPLASFGVPAGPDFSNTVFVGQGRNYFLLITNVGDSGTGFTLRVGGTAVIGPQVPTQTGVMIQGPTEICTGGTATFSTPPAPGSQFQWEVLPDGDFNISGLDPFSELQFPTAGTYDVCVTEFNADLDCFGSLPSCMSVTVEDLPNPAGFESGFVCTNDFFIAGNGDVFYFGGQFNLVYESWQSCDSIVRLNLTQTPTPYNYNTRAVCAGTCVEFNGETYCDGGLYEQVYESQYGCDSTEALLLISVPVETIITGGGTISCTTPSIVLNGSTSLAGQNPQYTWRKGNTVVGNTPVLTVTSGGIYTLSVRSTVSTDTCTTEASVNIFQNTTQPTAVATANGNINCNAATVQLSGTGSSVGSQYSYLWTTTNGSIMGDPTSLTPTANAAGNYLLTVTNTATGCTKTASTTVIARANVTASITSTSNISCFGATSGSATVAATGGNGVYSYAWSNGANTATAAGLGAGNYTVVVTDGEGCTALQSVVITQPSQLLANASATPQVLFGVNDGSATANPSGGTGTYTYAWSNPDGSSAGSSQTLNALFPGNYTVVITDANGCTASQTVTVDASTCNVSSTVTMQDVTCAGANDGSATVTLLNATAPLTFLWSSGQNTATATGLAGGTYSVSASDAFGCQEVATVIINEPLVLSANTIATNPSSFTAMDGTATATPNGGTGSYSYLWSNGANTATITGLAPGDYTVVVTDGNGCEATQTVTVEEFECTIASIEINAVSTSCNGSGDGQLTVDVVGGNAPFTYLWSNGGTMANITGLTPGTYIVSITDQTGCPGSAEATVFEPAPLGIEVIEMVEAECGASDGLLTVLPIGGTGGYSFVWENGETTPSVSAIPAGTYTVSITDAFNCTGSFDVVLGVDDEVFPIVVTQNITVELDANGQASTSATAVDNGSTDDCAIANTSIDLTNFDCSDLGENTVTLSVTDVGNNTSTGTAIVTVVDNLSPVLLLQDVTLQIGTNGTATLTSQLVDNGSTDNCGIATWAFSQTVFECGDAGANTVTVTATDASGNVGTGTMVVTILGSGAPSIVCPANIVLPFCEPVAEFEVTADDNCTGTATLTQTAGPASGSTFPVGATTVSFQATNASGNSVNCSFQVTLPPAMLLDIEVEDVSCFNEQDGSATVIPTGGAQPYSYNWSSGATTATASGLGVGNYTVSVTDAAGCSISQSTSVDEPTQFTAALVNIVNTTNNQNNGSIDVTVSGGTTPYTFSWKNTAGAVVGTTEDVSGLGAGTYVLTATDANGCISQSAYTIQNTTATSETDLDSHVMLYPNPTSGWVKLDLVDLASTEKVEVHAFDVTGRMVLNHQYAVSNQMMDFSKKSAGVYMLKIVVGDQMVTKRLVVTH